MPPAAAAAAPSPTAATPRTVTYTLTCSAADVTYGPAGSDYSGVLPTSKTASLNSNASYYAITAQLRRGGAVACSIAVDGRVL